MSNSIKHVLRKVRSVF